MADKLIRTIGIAAGICAILAGLFTWWGQYFPGFTYGFGLIGLILPNYFSFLPYFEPYNTLIIIFYIILIVSGVLILIASLTLKKNLSLIGIIVIIIGFIGELTSIILFAISAGLPLFQIQSGVYTGLSMGFFLGIAALVLAGFFLLALKKSTVKASA